MEIKENNLKFSFKTNPPQITTIGELVVEAIYDENFMLKNQLNILQEIFQ